MPRNGKSPPADSASTRPTVLLRPGENFSTVVHELAAQLVRARVPYYRRGFALVRAVTLSKADAKGIVKRASGAVMLEMATVPRLRSDINSTVDVRRHDKRSNKDFSIEVPADIATVLIEIAPDLHQFPVVKGISCVPLMNLRTGALNMQPGYDKTQEVIVSLRDTDFTALSVPDKPTEEQAKAALEVLLYPLQDFRMDPASRSVALSAMFTAVLRPVFTYAPMHAFSAPTPGTGKTILAQAVGIIATGVTPTAITLSDDKAVREKEFDAVILGGDHVALLDNVNGLLSSSTLCSLLTSQYFAVKLMYAQKNADCRNSTAWLVTGNNLRLQSELVRRTLKATLDAGVENPHLRTDFHIKGGAPEFLHWCEEHRMALLSAVFTIERWHIKRRAPRFKDSKQAVLKFALGNFEEWDRYVRQPLLWLGECDPLAKVIEAIEDDPDRESLLQVLGALALYGTEKGWTVSEILPSSIPTTDERLAAVWSALQQFKGHPQGFANGVGFFLRASVNRIVEGLVLRRVGTSHNVALWRVDKIDAEGKRVAAGRRGSFTRGNDE